MPPSYDAVPFSPPRYVTFRTDSGLNQDEVEIFHLKDNTDVELLQCPTCLQFVTFSDPSGQRYFSHRGSDQCTKALNRLVRERTKREADEALRSSGLMQGGPPARWKGMLLFISVNSHLLTTCYLCTLQLRQAFPQFG
jgi:hypothetical protein